MPYSGSFGSWLKELRKGLDITQEQLAERVGCAVTHISKIEQDSRRPSVQVAKKLAEHLEIAADKRADFIRFARTSTQTTKTIPHTDELRPPRQPLPMPPTPLVGREADVRAVNDYLLRADVRLLTLSGPPGVGKTRMALHAAGGLIDAFADGIYLVTLAPISDPELVIPTIARTLDLREAGGQPLVENLKDYLYDKQLLLLLDNFEQVVTAAPHVAELLAAAPRLKVLITSREVLHISGEYEYKVPPLALPPGTVRTFDLEITKYAAVRLFIQRAQAVKADFSLTNMSAPAVAEICHRLDGLPLAIELAAARTNVLTPQALLTRLNNRLDLLTDGPRDLPPRQQTLRGALEWSYLLLQDGERRMLRRLAVFAGDCALEAVEAVCGMGDEQISTTQSLLNMLAALLDQSLLRRETGVGDEPRYTMLETIREYALEQLGKCNEGEALQQWHAEYYLALAESAEPQLAGEQQEVWLARLAHEHHNLRAALAWLLERGEAEMALRLGSALWRFWYMQGYLSEGYGWLEKTLRSSSAQSSVRANALNGAGNLAYTRGDYMRATALHEESLTIGRELGDKLCVARSLSLLGVVAYEQGDYARATTLLEESLTLERELGNKVGIARSLNNLGNVAEYVGDYVQATTLHNESLALERELGNKVGVAISLNNLGEVALAQGDYARATTRLEERLTLSREVDDKLGVAISLSLLGVVAYEQGNYAQALALHIQSLTLHRELGDQKDIADCLMGLASVNGALGKAEQAARLFAAARALHKAIGVPLPPAKSSRYERDMAAARAQMNQVTFEVAWADGQAMPLQEAIAFALTTD